MRRTALIALLFCFGLPLAHAADIGKFSLPDNSLKWTREASLDKQFSGQVVRVRDAQKSEILLILPLDGTEASRGRTMETVQRRLAEARPGVKLDEAVRLNLGDRTWYGVGREQGGFVQYHGAVNNGRLVYVVDLRVPAPGEFSDAFKRFLAEVKIQRVVAPTQAAALMSQGNQLLNKKDYKGALARFDQAAAKDPRSPEVYYFRGMCHKRMKNYAAARKDLDKAIAMKKSSDFMVERADVEIGAQNYKEAFGWLDKSLAEDPESDQAFRYQGKAYYYAGQTEKSIAAYEKSLALNPADGSARASLVKLQAAVQKNTAAAVAQLQAYRAFHPGNPYAQELKQEILKVDPKARISDVAPPTPKTSPGRLEPGTLADQAPGATAHRAPEPAVTTGSGAAGGLRVSAAPPVTTVTATKESAASPSAGATGKKEGVTADTSAPASPVAAVSLEAAQAAFKELPPLPPLASMLARAKASPVAPRVDPGAFSQMQYLGAVSAVKQAMEELVGPMSPAAKVKFEAQWAAIYDFPADACVAYLNGASPLLGEILSLRASMMKVIQGYDNFINQARMARFFGNPAAAHDAMRRAGQHAALMQALKRRSDEAVKSLTALGELPDAALIKARAAEQYNAARSLLKNLDQPLELSGEYEPAPYQSLQDPYDGGRRRNPDDTLIRTELNEDYDAITYYQPLKSVGANLVLMYVCETDTDGDKSAWLQLFENQGNGRFVTYGGGSDLTKIVLELNEDGFQKTEYTLGPKEMSEENNDFSEKAAALIAKGKRPAMALTRDIRSRAFYATHVQYQQPPGDGEFNFKNWEKEFRNNEKEFLEEFQAERLAFETLAPEVGFPQPVPAEHIFWVLDRVEPVNPHPTGQHRLALYVENQRADAAYKQSMRRKKEDDPYPMITSARKTDLSQNSLSHRDDWTVFDDNPPDKPVHDRMQIAYDVSWTAPPPVIAQAGGRFEIDIKALRDASQPRENALVPSPWEDVTGAVTLAVVDKAGKHAGRGGDGARASLLARHLTSGPGKASETTRVQCPVDGLYGEYAQITLGIGPKELTGTWGANLRYHYERKIMTPDEAAVLSARMGDNLERIARKDATDREKKTAAAKDHQARQKQQQTLQAADAQARKETAEFHKANILYEQKRVQQYQQELTAAINEVKQSGEPPTEAQQKRIAALRFNIINAKSNAIAEQDNIQQLETGEYRRSETPFDSMARLQFRENIEKNIRKIEGVETQNELAEKYIELLPAAERAQAYKSLQKIRDEAPDDIARYQKLNAALKSKWQGASEAKLAQMDEDLAWKEAQVQAVENIKTGADVGMLACSMMGGPQALALTYQFATGWAEKDLLTGVKQSVSLYSDAVDIAWSTYDGYCQGGWEGAAKAGGVSLLTNKGLPFLLGRMTKGGDLPDAGGAVKAADNLSGAAKQAESSGPALKTGKPKLDDVKQYEAELRQAETQVKGFVSDYHNWKKAVKAGASEKEIEQLHRKVIESTAAINGNPAAKGYLKYQAQPAVGRIFNQSLDDVHAQARKVYYETMKKAGYSDHEIFAIRNAASSGSTGMDFDQALKEQPDWIPVKHQDGTTSLRRNVWLTKNGKPVSRHQWQLDAQAAWNDAYKKATHGAEAPLAWEKMTSKVDPEAYRMMSVLKIHKDLSNVDEIMDGLDPQWVRQMSDVTLFKAGEMLNDKNLSRLAGVREACRGTAKDLEGKFLPFISSRLDNLKKIPEAKRSASDQHNIQRLESALSSFTKVKESFAAIGKSEIPPSQWDDAINLSTGGRGIMQTIQDLSDLTQSLFK